MNQQQLKYARERADTIFKTARQKIWDDKRAFNEDDKIYELSQGRYSVKDTNGPWHTRIEFHKQPEDTTTKQVAELNRKYQTLLDELMLGDAQQALDMLNKFREAV